jgi:protein AbiQ
VIEIPKQNKLSFFDIEEKYLNYLRNTDSQVPEISKTSNSKFFCGIVLEINGFEYYVPISSFTKKQATNKIIYDEHNNPKASLRFCFMVPLPKNVSVKQMKDFSKISDQKYIGLLEKELEFCRKHAQTIKKDAKRVYQFGTNPQHKQYKNCCKFKELENAAQKWN